MKINQKKFNQLSQLDRIEFRQKEDRINKRIDKSYFFGVIEIITLLIGFCILVYVNLLNISIEIANRFMVDLNLPNLYLILVIILIISLFMDMVNLNQRNEALASLKEEFFENKTKSKK